MRRLAVHRPLGFSAGAVLIPIVGIKLVVIGCTAVGLSDVVGRLAAETLLAGYGAALLSWRAPHCQ
jgi:hypothetical protein